MTLSAVWKTEPLSPSVDEELTWFSEETLYSSLEQDDLKFETDILLCETKAEVASQLLENLESLVNIDELIKEEPFFMSDVKILPMLEEIEQSRYPLKHEILQTPVNIVKTEIYKGQEIIFSEFDPVGNVYNQALTPPQSPPCEEPILTTLKPLETPANFAFFQDKTTFEQPEKQLLDNVLYRSVEYPAAVTPQPDIAHELAVVDELVRTRVENMQWTNTPSSPSSNSGNSSSSFDDCFSDDPEWMPEAVESYPSNDPATAATKSPRKRTKPYSRCSPEDKKSRKKEQNKNAATRYRLKKKAEVEEILSEEKTLMNEGEKLGEKISDIQREIKYLKGLMRDLFKAKGLIN